MMLIYRVVKKLSENDLFEMVRIGLRRELESLRLYRKELEQNKKLYAENKRLREALHEIHENTRFAEVVTIRLKDVHEFARKALEGD